MNKLLIRPLEIRDASISWKWRNDSEIWQFTGSRPDREITYEIEHEWIQSVLNDKTSKRFAIMVDDQYIGNIQLTNIQNESADYHIFIGNKNYWGKNLSFLATYQILHFAKEELSLKNVYLNVRIENIRAIKLYLKNSFNKVSEDGGWINMNCSLMQVPAPMVSVFVIVYNHEKYLQDCLDGILLQKCNFTYNIVVGEDCSQDRSREILLEYKNKYPGKFKLLLHKKNIGAFANQMAVLEACSGKYIAICEGDDYWTDPYKLQMQVGFLEQNMDLMGVVTNSLVCDENGMLIKKEKIVVKPNNKEGRYNLHDFFRVVDHYPTNTVIFRNKNIKFVIDKMQDFSNLFFGDWTLWIVLHLVGDFYFLNSVTAAYRKNPTSLTNTFNSLKRWETDILIRNKLIEFLPNEYHGYLCDFTNSYFTMSMLSRDQKKYFKFIIFSFKALSSNPKRYLKIIYHLLQTKIHRIN